MRRTITGILSVLLMTIGISGGILSNSVFADEMNSICDRPGEVDPALFEAAGCNAKTTVIKNIIKGIHTVIGSVALIAIIMIVFAGQRFLVANGDPGKIKAAKDMILYAVVAVIVALLAFAITNFIAGIVQSNANLNIRS